MAKPDQKYFVSVEVKWGKVGDDGSLNAESFGGQTWSELDYAQSVAVQGAVIVPGVQMMLDQSITLGIDAASAAGFDMKNLEDGMAAAKK